MRPLRAEIITRALADHAFDAGIHAEADIGTIDLGLAVEPTAIGVILAAPLIGQLKVAFEIEANGTTHLTVVERSDIDGRPMSVPPRVVVDETEVRTLTAELERERTKLTHTASTFQERLAQLEREHHATREQVVSQTSHIHALTEALQAERQAVLRLEAERNTAQASFDVEKEGRLAALGERERARAELDRFREEQDAGTAVLMREVAEARAARDAAEHERSRLSQELSELSRSLSVNHDALKAITGEREDLAQQLATVTQQRDTLHREIERLEARTVAQAQSVATLEDSLREAGVKRDLAQRQLAELRAEHEQTIEKSENLETALASEHDTQLATSTRLKALEGQLSSERESIQTLTQHNATLTKEGERLREALAQSQERVLQLEEALSDHASTKSKLETALSDLSGAQAVSAEAKAVSEDLRRDLARTQTEKEALSAERDALTAALESSKADATGAISEWQAALETEKQRTEKSIAERDEARAVAKKLHQRLSANTSATTEALNRELKQLKESLSKERQHTEALQRMLDQERGNRVKIMAERDEFKARFRALTKETPASPLDSYDTTQSYLNAGRTDPNVPLVATTLPDQSTPVTQPIAQAASMPPKKKEP
jgi:chromosome segregation ATPase